MRRKDLRLRLEAMGREHPPSPREAFVEDLGDRLRMQGPGREPGPTPLRTRFALLAATVGLLALAGIAALVVGRDGESTEVQVLGAHDAIVVFPDGEHVQAREGLLVPDGSVVRTGPEGHLRADGNEIGPNREGLISQGRLRALEPEEAPEPTRMRTPRPTPPTVIDVTPRPTPAPTPRPTPRPNGMQDLGLMCEGVERGGHPVVMCRWGASTDGGFVAYQVWRDEHGDRTLIHRTADREATAFGDRQVEAGGRYTYLVEAIDREGRVVGSGGPVRVTVPR